VILLLIASGCVSPLIKVKRHWNAIQEELLKHPELADSLQLVKHDTIRSEPFVDRFVSVNDSATWDSSLFGEVDSLAAVIIKAPEEKKAVPLTKLQTVICPSLTKDSVYHVKVYNSKLTLWIPIHLSVNVKNGKINIWISGDAIKVPEPTVTKSLEFKSVKPKFYADQWFWMFVIITVIFVGSILIQLRNRNH
jgi:hypothetical protein